MNRLFPGQLEAVGPPFVFNTKLGGPIVSLANEHPRIGSNRSIKGNDLTSHPITFKSLRAAVMPGFCFKNGHRFDDKRSGAHLVIASKKTWSLTWLSASWIVERWNLHLYFGILLLCWLTFISYYLLGPHGCHLYVT